MRRAWPDKKERGKFGDDDELEDKKDSEMREQDRPGWMEGAWREDKRSGIDKYVRNYVNTT